MNIKPIILIFLLISLAIPASAEDIYQARLVVSGIQGTENNWVSEMWDLNESVTKPFMDTSITFVRIGINNQSGWFTVTGSGISNPAVSIIEGADAECIRGKCAEGNNVTGNEKSVQLMVIDYKLIHVAGTESTTSGTTTANTTDNPIYAYVYYDRELPMAEGKVNNFNGEDYVKQTGWTTEGGVSEVDVYFKRRDVSIPMAISVKAESTEPKVVWSDRTAKYTIDSNGKYTFTIKYETKNIWGWKEEFTEVYTLVTTGMSSTTSGSSSSAIVAEAPYEAVVGEEFVLTMSKAGKFDTQQDVEVIDAGNRKYAFTFGKSGIYELNFKGTDGGSAVVKFSVKSTTASAAAEAANNAATTTANLAQPQDGDGGSLIWYLILLIAVVGLGYMLISRKKKSTSYHLHPKTQ